MKLKNILLGVGPWIVGVILCMAIDGVKPVLDFAVGGLAMLASTIIMNAPIKDKEKVEPPK